MPDDPRPEPAPPGAFAPRRRPPADGSVRFGPDPTGLFPVLVLLVCMLPTVLASRWALLLLLVPLACAAWVLRARVVVRADGLEVSNGLGRRTVPWDRVEGFDVPRRGPVRLLTRGSSVPLTALPRRRVRDLVAASEAVSR